ALAMLNNVTFVESARFLAERMLRQDSSSPADRIDWAFRLVTSRAPQAGETELLKDDLAAYLRDFQAAPEAARRLLKTGEKPFSKGLDVPMLAAYTLVANTILNLDESMSQN
ncbi:MAG TPA: hypothetical protein DCG12_05780, partial [Planctomycetaceae bacterium]|nr:hypothetical protein [Planctomycetaceae bacterium]